MTLDCDRRVPSRHSESLTALLLLLGHDAHPCPGPSLGLHLKGHLVTRAFAMTLSPSARGHWSSQSSARNTLAASTLPGFHRGPPRDLVHRVKEFLSPPHPPELSPHALPGRVHMVGAREPLPSFPGAPAAGSRPGLSWSKLPGLSGLWLLQDQSQEIQEEKRHGAQRGVSPEPRPSPAGPALTVARGFSCTEGEGRGTHAPSCSER